MQTNDRNRSPSQDYLSTSSIPSNTEPTSATDSASPEPLTPSLKNQEKLIIPLLEERLQVNRRRQKIGEVIIRREVETRIVEVPVRREKLIVEQISPEFRQIAAIDLSETEISKLEGEPEATSEQALSAHYATVQETSRALRALAEMLAPHCRSVSLTMFFQRGTSDEKTSHRCETLATAIQLLESMAFLFTKECHAVELKLVAPGEVLQEVYRHWIEQTSTDSSSPLAKAKVFLS